MPKRDARIRKAYRFFCDAERDEKEFTLDEVAQATGWSIATVKSYRSKKWHFILRPSNDNYTCEGVCSLSEDAFVRLHAQRVPLVGDVLRPRYSPRVDALIDKSRESALLAVQTYNNPLISFRTPGFIVQMVIAFTSFFHAVFDRDGVEYWDKDKAGNPILIEGDNRYWEFKECLKQYFGGQTTAVTENLRLLSALRNKIEHRFLPALDIQVSGFCQAALMNFEELLVAEFGEYFSLRSGLMLALQLTEYSDELNEALKSIQADQYDAIQDYIEAFAQPLPDDIVQSPRFSFRAFLVPKIGNHASSSDIAIDFVRYDPEDEEDMERYERQIALIKEKRVQVADQGMHKPSDVIQEVEQRTGFRLRMYDHTQAWKYYRIRSRDGAPEGCDVRYCQYSEPFQQIIYTDAWVEFLAERVQDQDELERIRNHRD